MNNSRSIKSKLLLGAILALLSQPVTAQDTPQNDDRCFAMQDLQSMKMFGSIQDHDGQADPAHGHIMLAMEPKSRTLKELKFMGRGRFVTAFHSDEIKLEKLSAANPITPQYSKLELNIGRPRFTSAKFGSMGEGWLSENITEIELTYKLDGKVIIREEVSYDPDETEKTVYVVRDQNSNLPNELFDWAADETDRRSLSLEMDIFLIRYRVRGYGGVELERKEIGKEHKFAVFDYGAKPQYESGFNPFGWIARLTIANRRGLCEAF